MNEYYAKSADGNGEKVTNKQHLLSVAKLAEHFGNEVNMPGAAYIAGLLHDFGKYSSSFQNVLMHTQTNIDHAICAAAYLHFLGKTENKKAYRMIAEVTAAHHGALRSYAALKPELDEICRAAPDEKTALICSSGKKPALIGRKDYESAQKAFACDFPEFKFIKLEMPVSEEAAREMLRTRMLFSCLVDADYSASAGADSYEPSGLKSKEALDCLYSYMKALRAGSSANKSLNAVRDEVFQKCGDAGDMPSGMFKLTAPTGVGKTLALLHFALRHCARNGKRRIILVLPFLTLTEQSQKVYEKLIPNILCDHSQSRLSEEERTLAARWEAPFIITTSVRFFESLFSSRPKDCRKLHNIAESVILFDEAQSLPPELCAQTMRAASALCSDYGCTVVLSTATQPEFSALAGAQDIEFTEILPECAEYYNKLNRVNVNWKIREESPLNDIAAEMAEKSSVCAIVNLRRHARELFDLLKSRLENGDEDGVYYISTDLCPAHRSKIIETIAMRLQKGLPCRVVSTQCIEAGVDLDFEYMYRALAPLESIIQAAGRCNRNGVFSGGGVTVFIPEDNGNIYPGNSYRNGAITAKLTVETESGNINDLNMISQYYKTLFDSIKSAPELESAIAREDYEKTEKEYKLIKNRGVRVIVPYDGESELFKTVKERAENGVTAGLIKEAAPITVSCFNEELVKKCCEQIPWSKRGTAQPEKSDFYILCAGKEKYYNPETGLDFKSDASDEELFV